MMFPVLDPASFKRWVLVPSIIRANAASIPSIGVKYANTSFSSSVNSLRYTPASSSSTPIACNSSWISSAIITERALSSGLSSSSSSRRISPVIPKSGFGATCGCGVSSSGCCGNMASAKISSLSSPICKSPISVSVSSTGSSSSITTGSITGSGSSTGTSSCGFSSVARSSATMRSISFWSI